MCFAPAFGIGGGIGAGEIHAHQPVGTRACQACLIQGFGFAAWHDFAQCLFYRSRIQPTGPEAGHFTAIATILQNLAPDDLTFTISIGSNNNFIRFGQ